MLPVEVEKRLVDLPNRPEVRAHVEQVVRSLDSDLALSPNLRTLTIDVASTVLRAADNEQRMIMLAGAIDSLAAWNSFARREVQKLGYLQEVYQGLRSWSPLPEVAPVDAEFTRQQLLRWMSVSRLMRVCYVMEALLPLSRAEELLEMDHFLSAERVACLTVDELVKQAA